MRLTNYLSKLYAIIESRHEIAIEYLVFDETIPGQEGMIEGRLRFWDGSLLAFVEILSMQELILVKTHYAYHYQNANAQLVFRYDNAPHHPEAETHPHHKHSRQSEDEVETIEPAKHPHLTEIFREIDQHLYE